MAPDMKEIIAKASRKLIFEKNVKKLTVKDIVKECQITRQTFYYHFEDIPSLIRWDLEKNMPIILEEVLSAGNPEEGMLYLFRMALAISPYIKKVMQTNYKDEIECLLEQFVYQLFEKIWEYGCKFKNCSRFELNLILRYHSQAILGLLKHWTEDDTKNLEQIAHQVFLMITGDYSSFS